MIETPNTIRTENQDSWPEEWELSPYQRGLLAAIYETSRDSKRLGGIAETHEALHRQLEELQTPEYSYQTPNPYVILDKNISLSRERAIRYRRAGTASRGALTIGTVDDLEYIIDRNKSALSFRGRSLQFLRSPSVSGLVDKEITLRHVGDIGGLGQVRPINPEAMPLSYNTHLTKKDTNPATPTNTEKGVFTYSRWASEYGRFEVAEIYLGFDAVESWIQQDPEVNQKLLVHNLVDMEV